MSTTIEQILVLDATGNRTQRIAQLLGITEPRVSIIKNCPMYKDRIAIMRAKLDSAVIDKQSDKVVNDPAREKLFGLKLNAVQVYEDVMKDNLSSAFAKLNAANQVCDRTDLRPQQAEKAKTIVQITQKIGEDWTRAIRVVETTNSEEVIKP